VDKPPQQVAVDITLLGREYRVAGPAEQREALLEAARYLDEKMRQIRDSGKVVGSERIAVMAALNISHELLEARRELERVGALTQERVYGLLGKLESALNKVGKMDV